MARKNIKIDLVIVDDEKNSYEQYTLEKIYECINSKNLNYLINIIDIHTQQGNIHLVQK